MNPIQAIRDAITPPPAMVDLPKGARACADCGVAVENSTVRVQVVSVEHVAQIQGQVVLLQRPAPIPIDLTRCDADQSRLLWAEQLLHLHTGFRRRLGGMSYAVSALDDALVVFDALGLLDPKVDPKFTERLVESAADLERLLRVLGPLGARLRYSARLAPVTTALGASGRVSRTRWSHLEFDPEPLAEARAAFKKLLTDRFRGPQAVPLPSDADCLGCLFCGIGAVTSGQSWGDLRKVSTATVGGAPRPAPVKGYLCPACGFEVDQLGMVGMSAVERAFCKATGIRQPRSIEGETLDGLKAFAARPVGTPANPKPWDHMDIEGLKRLEALRTSPNPAERKQAELEDIRWRVHAQERRQTLRRVG